MQLDSVSSPQYLVSAQGTSAIIVAIIHYALLSNDLTGQLLSTQVAGSTAVLTDAHATLQHQMIELTFSRDITPDC